MFKCFLLFMICLLQLGRTETFSQSTDRGNLAHTLAIIDRGTSVRPKDKIVQRYSAVLSRLSSKFWTSTQNIADQSARTKELLESDAGVYEKVLNIMEGVDEFTPRSVGKTTYAECVAAYMTLRQKGYSHREAVEGLSEIFHTLSN